MDENTILQLSDELAEEDGYGAFLADSGVEKLEPRIHRVLLSNPNSSLAMSSHGSL